MWHGIPQLHNLHTNSGCHNGKGATPLVVSPHCLSQLENRLTDGLIGVVTEIGPWHFRLENARVNDAESLVSAPCLLSSTGKAVVIAIYNCYLTP